MAPDTRRRLSALAFLILPLMAWLGTAHYFGLITRSTFTPERLYWLAKVTPHYPIFLGALAFGVVLAVLVTKALSWRPRTQGFAGAPYKRFVRGTRVATKESLIKLTRESCDQISVAGIPMPSEVESLHLLICGATGSGKSVLLRELTYSALRRGGDRMFAIDPDGGLLSRFGKPGDIILNPYDARTQGWSFFNEIREPYDWVRFSYSIVPLGQDANSEVWNSFGRLLLRETAKKLAHIGNPCVKELASWCTLAHPKDLRTFLHGTDAESLFVGGVESNKALDSARFVLSDKLPEHKNMPEGSFSIRDWMMDENGGNLFVTWREDMGVAMKPLVSAWADVFATSILSLPASDTRRWWLNIDELASLEKLRSLQDALTKGRKHGLRIVAGLQTTSQLSDIYGEKQAQTLRASFRSLIVLGGAKTDPQTAEDMSKSLGEHEVERDNFSENLGVRSNSLNARTDRKPERVVTAAEISSLPDLTGYVAFAGDRPIARVKIEPITFEQHTTPFVETSKHSYAEH